jgi:tRNA pseudouridine38-40 synthase
MPRFKLTVAYDGTQFHGWQKQQKDIDAMLRESADSIQSPQDVRHVARKAGYVPAGHETVLAGETKSASESSAEPWSFYTRHEIRTVQGILEQAVRTVIGEPVKVLGASRTDAGVHARGQVAAFTSDTKIPLSKLPRAINSRLPNDVQVVKAEIVSDEFDPISDCIAKGYRYRIVHGCRGRRPLFDRHFVTHTAYDLDPARMNEAARLMLGEHDFASFARISHGRESTVRTLYECKVTATRKHRCQLDIAGNGFLYNMIRIIAGTLVEIGRPGGKFEPEDIVKILDARNREAAGPTMGPSGLCLMWVRYG